MAWLWASSTPIEKAPGPADKESAPPPTASASTSTSTPSSSPSSTSTSDLSTDPEIQKFLDLFDTKSKPSDQAPSASSPSSQKPTDQSSSISSWFSARSSPSSSASRAKAEAIVEAPPGDPLSESLLPTDLSCRTAFDQAWACNSMGGQWNAIYRYGEMRSCTEHWDDFWFCMRIKSYGKEMRENLIRAHHRNKNHEKYGPGKPNSEDVWQGREEKVVPGSVFNERIE